MDPRLHIAANALLRARKGEKRTIIDQLASDLGCTRQTAYKRLQPLLAAVKPRKRRSDAGQTSLPRQEILWIAAAREETRRQTGTGTLPLQDVVAVGRANGSIRTERLDRLTGELRPVHVSTVQRALRRHALHESQLAAASPAARLRSEHPNHVWQIDASLSRQFYLADDGARVMPKAEFYRGKPKNFERISQRRLWRYVITDHASGCIEVFYVLGAESAANLVSALIHAMTDRPGGTMHGVPRILMADPGSAVTAAAITTCCQSLGIDLLVHAVGNPRATGQVENAHHLVETHFEALLKLTAPVSSLEEINTKAQQWAYSFNASKVHSRTGLKRRDGWLRIRPDQLVLAPPIDVLRQLPHSKPKTCVVRDCMIRFKNELYDVRGIPGLINRARVDVIVNALDPAGSIRVLMPGEQGNQPVQYLAPRIERGAFGFLATAATIGQEFRSPPETPADAARKEIDRLAMEVRTDAEAKAARKARKLPFGGTIDPLKHLRDVPVPPHLPRTGVQKEFQVANVVAAQRIEPDAPKREFAPYTHMEAINTIKPELERRGLTWSAAMLTDTVHRYPDGVPYDELHAWTDELWRRYRLQLVPAQEGAA